MSSFSLLLSLVDSRFADETPHNCKIYVLLFEFLNYNLFITIPILQFFFLQNNIGLCIRCRYDILIPIVTVFYYFCRPLFNTRVLGAATVIVLLREEVCVAYFQDPFPSSWVCAEDY